MPVGLVARQRLQVQRVPDLQFPVIDIPQGPHGRATLYLAKGRRTALDFQRQRRSRQAQFEGRALFLRAQPLCHHALDQLEPLERLRQVGRLRDAIGPGAPQANVRRARLPLCCQ